MSDRAANIVATAIITAGVSGAMIWRDAPTWAWLGIGAVTWITTVER